MINTNFDWDKIIEKKFLKRSLFENMAQLQQSKRLTTEKIGHKRENKK